MACRPYVSFAEVKQKVPIPEALESLALLERFQRRGEALVGVCPLPDHQHGPSPNAEQFRVNRKDGLWLWHCFGDCQRGGDVVELVKSITGYDDAHVRFWFAEHFGERLTLGKPRKRNGAAAEKKKTTRDDPGQVDQARAASKSKSIVSKPVQPLKSLRFTLNLQPDVSYLRQRGLSPDTIHRYGLGLCNRGVLADYVAIPVYGCPREPDDRPLVYLGRWPGEDYDEAAGRPRYKWPEGFAKSRVVYGLAEALDQTDGQPLIVVEGPFTVYHLVQSGFSATVAIFGSAMSGEQAAILADTGRPIVLLFDGDEAGRAGMRTAAAKLITRCYVRVVKLADGLQPEDVSSDNLATLLAK